MLCEEEKNAAITAADVSGVLNSLFFYNCQVNNREPEPGHFDASRKPGNSEVRRSLCLRMLRSSSGPSPVGPNSGGGVRATWGCVTSSPGAEGDWTCGALPALRVGFALVQRAEVPAGLCSDPGGGALCGCARSETSAPAPLQDSRARQTGRTRLSVFPAAAASRSSAGTSGRARVCPGRGSVWRRGAGRAAGAGSAPGGDGGGGGAAGRRWGWRDTAPGALGTAWLSLWEVCQFLTKVGNVA